MRAVGWNLNLCFRLARVGVGCVSGVVVGVVRVAAHGAAAVRPVGAGGSETAAECRNGGRAIACCEAFESSSAVWLQQCSVHGRQQRVVWALTAFVREKQSLAT
jgi:hypothetical protein